MTWAVFGFCEKLKRVTLPEGIKKIGDSSFAYCDALQEITLPYNLTEIDMGAFDYCNALRKIVRPNDEILETDLRGYILKFKDNDIPITDNISPNEVKSIKKEMTGRYYEWSKLSESELKRKMVRGFVRAPHKYSPDIRAEYEKYIIHQRKRLYNDVVRDDVLLKYMMENKIIPLRDISELLRKTDDINTKADIMHYSNNAFTEKEKDTSHKKAFSFKL